MKKIFESIGGSVASAYTSIKYGKDVISPNLPATFYELKASTLSPKQPLDFASLKEKVVLVVNIASMCGYTAGNNKFLSNLASEYKGREDFVILAFPCGQFAGQELADETKVCAAHMEGLKDCKECLGKSLMLMEKVDVNGDSAHEVFKWLRTNSELYKEGKVAPIPWNYGKFLIGTDGKVVQFFKSGAYDEVKSAVAAELANK
jgi:glutathione peroxidase